MVAVGEAGPRAGKAVGGRLVGAARRALGVISSRSRTASIAHVPEKFWQSEKHGFTFPEVKEFILGNPGFTA